MCNRPLQKALDLLPTEFNNTDLITALKKCGRGIDVRSALHRYRTQGRIIPVSHNHYRKVFSSLNSTP